MKYQHIPTNLILGFLGVGKTTSIKHLLAHKPEGESWAVLVNEFGQVGVDGVLLEDSGVAIKEIPGGCLCCVGSQSMAVGLNQLIKQAKPDRILIEPTGLGHPAQLIENLTDSYFSDVLELQATITLVDARNLNDVRYLEHPSFTDQIYLADVLVANKADAYQESEKERFLAYASALEPAKLRLGIVSLGQVPLEWLSLSRSSERKALFPEAHQFIQQNGDEHDHDHDHIHHPVKSLLGLRYEGVSDGYYSIGWLLEADSVFDEEKLKIWLRALGYERAKGVVATENGWLIFNLTQDSHTFEPIEGQQQGRVELIHSQVISGDLLEQGLSSILK